MSSSRAGSVPSRIGVRSMMTSTHSPRRVMPPHVLIDPEDPQPVQAGRMTDQDPAAPGQDGVVGGVPEPDRRSRCVKLNATWSASTPAKAQKRPRPIIEPRRSRPCIFVMREGYALRGRSVGSPRRLPAVITSAINQPRNS